jgi:hypothetical protein
MGARVLFVLYLSCLVHVFCISSSCSFVSVHFGL